MYLSASELIIMRSCDVIREQRYNSIHVLYPLNLNNYNVTLNKVRSISRRLRDYRFWSFIFLQFKCGDVGDYPKDKYNEFGNVWCSKKRLIRAEKRCFVTYYDLDNKF